MRRLRPEVARVTLGDQVVLWQNLTGRHVALAPDALDRALSGEDSPTLRPLLDRLRRLHLLDDGPAPDRAALIPARSRLVLLLPEIPALWLPLPGVRTAGGHGYAARPLSEAELRLWREMNGARPLAAVARQARVPLEQALAFLADLTRVEVQVVQLRAEPASPRDGSLARLVEGARPPADRPAHLYGAAGETTLGHYHQVEIDDAASHFDDRETTVAHAFALPHPGLQGQTYGARLYALLRARGALPGRGGVTLEIGPGTGELGAALRAAWTGLDGTWLRLDRSPTLLAAQAALQPGTQGLLGDAEQLPLGPQSVDLVLCNEVIADLTAAPYVPGSDSALEAEIEGFLDRYGLEPPPPGSLVNLGAWRLMVGLAAALRPGGLAWISEFGGLDERPQETEQLDHPEVSIDFGRLAALARALGLEAEVLPLDEALGVDPHAVWLSRQSYEALRARMRAEGRTLQARAWTPETLPLPWPVEGLQWVSLAEPGPGPLMTRFCALIVRRV